MRANSHCKSLDNILALKQKLVILRDLNMSLNPCENHHNSLNFAQSCSIWLLFHYRIYEPSTNIWLLSTDYVGLLSLLMGLSTLLKPDCLSYVREKLHKNKFEKKSKKNHKMSVFAHKKIFAVFTSESKLKRMKSTTHTSYLLFECSKMTVRTIWNLVEASHYHLRVDLPIAKFWIFSVTRKKLSLKSFS